MFIGRYRDKIDSFYTLNGQGKEEKNIEEEEAPYTAKAASGQSPVAVFPVAPGYIPRSARTLGCLP
jgi:hypothetical protein